MITPDQLAASDTEAAHQKALFAWAALNTKRYPCLAWLFHIPNGGSRGDTATARAIRGNDLKLQGVKTGVADIFLPVPTILGYNGLFIELKRPSLKPKQFGKGGISKEQQAFATFVMANGYHWQACYGWQEASDCIMRYLSGDI